MTRLRDRVGELADAIESAAEALGLSPVFVEKDYWATEVLRALHHSHPGAFVFKGGTSLSKGYGIIERFSEDVDILVQPARGDTVRARELLLRRMSQNVAAQLGSPLVEARPPGRGRWPHRADVLAYPRVVSASVAVPTEDRGVLLETGYAGRDWPSEMVVLQPLLREPLGIEPGTYDDADPFSVRALHPARTLVEKLSLLHHTASSIAAGSAAADRRCGRHYYDIDCLLRHSQTLRALGDRVQFELMTRDVEAVSSAHFGGSRQRPSSGYADSPAFAPPHGSKLRRWLERRYDASAELLPAHAASRWPTFGEVLRRIAEHRELL